jgi:SAM-dependent methyltransferase
VVNDDGGVRSFYDSLAGSYDLIFPSWDASIGRQSRVISRLLADLCGAGRLRVLDCACGIGTQTLGLAMVGHEVAATDISSRAVQRAAREADRRGLSARFLVADMRRLPFAPGSFDAVMCADNSLPHLLTDADLDAACAAMAAATRPGGALLVSLRDYERLTAERPAAMPPSVNQTDGSRVITFQLWRWHADGERYELEHFQLIESGGHWHVERRQTTYRALTRRTLDAALTRAGWESPTWHEPSDSGFYQPIVTARRAPDLPSAFQGH